MENIYQIRPARIKSIPEGKYEGFFKGKPAEIIVSSKNQLKRKVCYFRQVGHFDIYHISGISKNFGYHMEVFLFSSMGILLTGSIAIGDLSITKQKQLDKK